MKRTMLSTVGPGLLELLLLLPVWLIVDAYLTPEPFQWIWLAGLLPLQWLGLAAGDRLKVAWQQWLLALAAGAGVGYATFAASPLFAFGMASVSVLVLLLGMSQRSRQSNTKMISFGVIFYFVSAIGFPLVEALKGYVAILSAGGLIGMVIVLFVLNRRFLRTASLAAKRPASVPAALRSHNAVFMAVLTGIVILVTLIFGKSMGGALFEAIRWLLSKLLSGGAPPEVLPPEPPAQPSAPPMLPGPGEKGLLGHILDILGIIFLVAVAVGILYGVGYWLFKHSGGIVKQWLKRLASWLSRRSPEEEENAGYTDEEKSVFSWEEVSRGMRESWLGRLLGRSRGERWEDTRTNAEKVRFLYRRWLRSAVERGYEMHSSFTPRETEADINRWLTEKSDGQKTGKLIQLYYQVRYAGKDVNADEVERMRQELEDKR